MLLIFDEIQECPSAVNSLKYFQEEANDYVIAAAGSLLGVRFPGPHNFPVGKVNFLDMFPLTFFEFLDAIGKNQLRTFLETLSGHSSIPDSIHNELMELFKRYTVIGGMPEAVSEYIESRDLEEVRKVQREILNAYTLDFSKHAPANDVTRISEIWDSVPSQLSKENKKFIFSAIKGSARSREYESAIQWLYNAGLIYKSYLISNPMFPLDRYLRPNAFKVYLLDTGLLGAMVKLPAQMILEGHQLFMEFRGAIAENIVAQEISARFPKSLFYWSSQGLSEVDFILPYELNIYPLEVKAGHSKLKKSLKVYGERYHPPVLSRATAMNLKKDGEIHNYPLYLTGRFPALFKS